MADFEFDFYHGNILNELWHKNKKKTKKHRQNETTTATTTSKLLLSLNVVNLATNNFCYLWQKFDVTKILGRNGHINHICLSFQSYTSGLKFVTYLPTPLQQYIRNHRDAHE